MTSFISLIFFLLVTPYFSISWETTFLYVIENTHLLLSMILWTPFFHHRSTRSKPSSTTASLKILSIYPLGSNRRRTSVLDNSLPPVPNTQHIHVPSFPVSSFFCFSTNYHLSSVCLKSLWGLPNPQEESLLYYHASDLEKSSTHYLVLLSLATFGHSRSIHNCFSWVFP